MSMLQVMIVEDEALIALDIYERLQAMGYSISGMAASADEATALCLSRIPDVVLMDIMLRGPMDGIALAGVIRTRYPSVAIVYLTAYADDATIARAVKMDASGYLVKPFNDRELKAAIELACYKMRTEEKLRANERKFRSVLEKSYDGILLIDVNDGTIIEWNDALERISGVGRREANGAPFHALWDKITAGNSDISIDNTALYDFISPSSAQDMFEIPGFSLERADGTKRFVEVMFYRIRDNVKPIIGATIRDATERKRQERVLLQSYKLKSLGVLASGMAHEINQPMTGILLAIGHLDNMITSGKLTGDIMRLKLQDINGYVDRVRNIIDEIRLFSREQPESAVENFNVTLVLEKLDTLLGAQYRQNGINLRFEYDTELLLVRGNIYKLEQAIINILSNARYAVSQKSSRTQTHIEKSIVVSTGQKDNAILISVRDNGTGMSAEVQKDIFTPFFTTKPVGEGTGLGLSITYGILESMNGTITVDSREGEYTDFVIKLPKIKGD